jgi:hypothetical protein
VRLAATIEERSDMVRWAIGIGLAVLLPLLAGPAAAMSEAEVTAKVAGDYSVDVLQVRRAALDGRQVFLVTMMNQGGDFNEAFQVNTIAVDVESGELVPGFRHRPSGADANQAPSYGADRQPTNVLQSGVLWR